MKEKGLFLNEMFSQPLFRCVRLQSFKTTIRHMQTPKIFEDGCIHARPPLPVYLKVRSSPSVINPDSAIEQISMNFIQIFSPCMLFAC